MNTDQKRRIVDAIADCDRFIEREEKRNALLRPGETQTLLDWHYTHRDKLAEMLTA